MAIILKVKRIGNSNFICLVKGICKKFDLKHGDILVLEEVEIEKDILSKTLTARYGEDIDANGLILKKNNEILKF